MALDFKVILNLRIFKVFVGWLIFTWIYRIKHDSIMIHLNLFESFVELNISLTLESLDWIFFRTISANIWQCLTPGKVWFMVSVLVLTTTVSEEVCRKTIAFALFFPKGCSLSSPFPTRIATSNFTWWFSTLGGGCYAGARWQLCRLQRVDSYQAQIVAFQSIQLRYCFAPYPLSPNLLHSLSSYCRGCWL